MSSRGCPMQCSLPSNMAHYTNKSMEVCVNRQVAGLESGHGLFVVPRPTVQTMRQFATVEPKSNFCSIDYHHALQQPIWTRAGYQI